MALFDALISDVASKFNLGNKAGPLLAEALRFMTDSNTGGLAGFIDRFRKAGLGDLVTSWIGGGGAGRALTSPQLESAVGADWLGRVASRLGLGNSVVTSALAYAVPKLIGLLTPDGKIPTGIPAAVTSFLTSPQATVPVAPAAAVPPARAVEEPARGGLSKWLWLIPLALLALLGWWLTRPAPQPVATTPPPVATQPVAAVNPTLAISNSGGKIQYSGTVRDEPTRASILDALKGVFGEGNINGAINLNPNAAAAGWLANLKAAFENFKIPGLDVLFDGNKINVGGWLSDADRAALLDKLKGIFGTGYTFGFLGDKATDVFKAASDRTLAALNALKPGFTRSDLVAALNLSIINFDTNSANIAADSKPILDAAARALKMAPSGTVIEISGHTDSTGDAAANQTLSQASADSVKAYLVQAGVPQGALVAKGYGASRPVASNDTAEGRFQNRRIEFAVAK